MKIAIYGSRRQHDHIAPVEAFLQTLDQRGDEVVMHRKLYDHLVHICAPALKCVRRIVDGPEFSADIAVSLGGDGTFLRTAMWVADKQIPIVGVNTGHLGYLAALAISDLPRLPELLARDCFRQERRGLIRVEAEGLPARLWPYALNEIALTKEESSSMITADVSIDNQPLAHYRADGLIVCTSTGSTAYNLSVGGPIVQPTVDVRVIAPVAAHSLSIRPLVVGASTCIDITADARASHVRLSLDGRSASLPVGTGIRLTDAPFKTIVMQLRDASFADTLREKLHWAETNS